jgi:tight adherence protein B
VHLINTAQNQNATAVAALLNEFAQNLRSDIALVNEIAGKQAVTRVSAKVAALAPFVVLLLTSSRSTVRNAYLTPTGLLVIAGTLSVTYFSYLMMRRISQIKVLSVD